MQKPKRDTTERKTRPNISFEVANQIHNNKYNYSLIDEPIKKIGKYKIICPIHGEFEQRWSEHIIGQGCPKCAGVGLSKEEKINEAIKIHGNRYDYSYIFNDFNKSDKIKIVCPIHGIFEQSWASHVNKKAGCAKCAGYYKSLEDKIIQANKIHNNRYNYNYLPINFKTFDSVIIKCPEHGIFEQIWNNHINMKQGCPKCAGCDLSLGEKISQANKIHNNKYDYSLLSNVFKSTDKVNIICPAHGVFKQAWNCHTNMAHGCPKCKESKGEIKIRWFLEDNNISFISQKRFPNCKYKRALPFDFYLPDYNTCIEFDGKQHSIPTRFNGINQDKANGLFLNTQIKDKIRNEYCELNNIQLIRIDYKDFNNIENILKDIVLNFKL